MSTHTEDLRDRSDAEQLVASIDPDGTLGDRDEAFIEALVAEAHGGELTRGGFGRALRAVGERREDWAAWTDWPRA